MTNKKCNVENCDLDVYEHHDECILHYKKSIDNHHYQGFLVERNVFYEELKNYIAEQFAKKDGLNESRKIFDSHRYLLKNGSEKINYIKENIEKSKESKSKIKIDFIHLKDIHFPRPDHQGRSYISLLDSISQICFDSCYFYGGELKLEGEVLFQDCNFCNSWNLFDYKVLENIDNVIYSHCTFEKSVRFEAIESTNEEGIQVTNGDLSQSQFDYCCKFKGELIINNAIIKKNIFNDKQGNFLENNLGGKVEFNSCFFKEDQEFYVTDNVNTEFLLNKCSFDNKFKIRGSEYDENGNEIEYKKQPESKVKLKELKIIDCTAANDTYLRVGFLEVEQFELSNLRLPQNAELNIGECHFKNFKLINFRNLGKFKLYKINVLEKEYRINKEVITEKSELRKNPLYTLKFNKIKPTLYECCQAKVETTSKQNKLFQIDNTSIGKTDFQSLNLDSFEMVKMFDNIFSEIDYTNIQWKKEVEVGQFGTSKNTEIAKKRDTYRTLKNVAQRNNDHPQALIFYQKEMENHWQITKWKKEFGNKLTLAFNKITNNFGLNWWMPLLWLSGLSIIFYSLLLYSLDMPFNVLWHWNDFLYFLNPLHKSEFISSSWDFCSNLIDFIFRIITGLLLYQTAQAFRKYSRKL